jgi:hypothetical protein
MHASCHVSQGGLEHFNQSSKQSAICVIFVAKAIIEDALDGHGLRTPAEDGWRCSQVSRQRA